MRTQLILNDCQIPYHDRVLGLVLRWSAQYQPDDIVLAGDIADFQAVSLKYHAAQADRRVDYVDFDLKQVRQFLLNLRELNSRAAIWYLGGNHEERLLQYRAKHAKALRHLPELDLPELLKLKSLRIEYRPYGDLLRLGKLHVTHGEIVRKHAGWTAKASYERYGVPVVVGHSHRGGAYYVTTHDRTAAAWENFCLCSMKQPYLRGTPNWQHGFSVVHNDMRRRFHLLQVPIIGGQFVYDGELWRLNPHCTAALQGVRRAAA